MQARQRRGPIFVFDPFGLSGVAAHTWSPLHAARTWDGALEVAWRLAAAGELDQRAVEGGDFWGLAAEQRLAPLLHVAAASNAGIEAWCAGPTGRGIASFTKRSRNSAAMRAPRRKSRANAAYDAVVAFENQADRTRSSIEATVQALLRAYRFARRGPLGGRNQITADALLDSRATLYLIGDREGVEALAAAVPRPAAGSGRSRL